MAIRDGRKKSSERTSILGNGRYEIMAISAIEMAIWIVTEQALSKFNVNWSYLSVTYANE